MIDRRLIESCNRCMSDKATVLACTLFKHCAEKMLPIFERTLLAQSQAQSCTSFVLLDNQIVLCILHHVRYKTLDTSRNLAVERLRHGCHRPVIVRPRPCDHVQLELVHPGLGRGRGGRGPRARSGARSWRPP